MSSTHSNSYVSFVDLIDELDAEINEHPETPKANALVRLMQHQQYSNRRRSSIHHWLNSEPSTPSLSACTSPLASPTLLSSSETSPSSLCSELDETFRLNAIATPSKSMLLNSAKRSPAISRPSISQRSSALTNSLKRNLSTRSVSSSLSAASAQSALQSTQHDPITSLFGPIIPAASFSLQADPLPKLSRKASTSTCACVRQDFSEAKGHFGVSRPMKRLAMERRHTVSTESPPSKTDLVRDDTRDELRNKLRHYASRYEYVHIDDEALPTD